MSAYATDMTWCILRKQLLSTTLCALYLLRVDNCVKCSKHHISVFDKSSKETDME